MSEKSTAIILRVAHAKYKQGNTILDEADDLSEWGLSQLEETMSRIAFETKRSHKFRIFSSESGRALDMAKRLYEYALDHGALGVESLTDVATNPNHFITVMRELNEIINFNPIVFRLLIHGGEEEIEGKKYISEAKNTNPENLSQKDYFMSRYWENGMDLSFLPEKSRKQLMRVEKFDALKKRVNEALRPKIIKTMFSSTNTRNVFIGHQEPLRILIGKSLQPGHFVELSTNGAMAMV